MSESGNEITKRIQNQEDVKIYVNPSKPKKKDWDISKHEITKILEYVKTRQILSVFFALVTIGILCGMVHVKFPNLTENKHVEAHAILFLALVIVGNIITLVCFKKSYPINLFLSDTLFWGCCFSLGTSFGVHLLQFFQH